MNAIRMSNQRNWLRHATVVTLLVFASCAGCSKANPKATVAPAAPPYLTELRTKMYELEVTNQKLANELVRLRKKKEEEEALNKGPASQPTQDDYAKAQVDFKNGIAQLMDRFDKFEAEMKAKGKSTELSPETIKLITDMLKEEIKLGRNQDVIPTPTATSSTSTSSTTPGGDMGEGFKLLLKAAGAALCAAQPELCPLLGPIFSALGLFGSTEECQAFLEAVGSQAAGTPLTDAQTAAVAKAIGKGYGNMEEGLKDLMYGMGKVNPRIQAAVQAAAKVLLGELGISEAQYKELLVELKSNKSNDEKFKAIQKLYPTFQNKSIQQKIVKLATELGNSELGTKVKEIPVQ